VLEPLACIIVAGRLLAHSQSERKRTVARAVDRAKASALAHLERVTVVVAVQPERP
jgi:hypothetical protein